MPALRVRTRHPLHDAMLSASGGTALPKPVAPAQPGALSVPDFMQTITSAGTTPAQNVTIANSNPSSGATPAGIAGSIDFGSLTGSVNGKWMMWAGIAVVAYLILRKR